jgi:hypothetical protein
MEGKMKSKYNKYNEYTVYDLDGQPIGIEFDADKALFFAARVARGLRQPLIVSGYGVHCLVPPDPHAELAPIPPDWRPAY